MTVKPNLYNANVVKRVEFHGERPSFISEKAWEKLKSGNGNKIIAGGGELSIGSKFQLIEYNYSYGADGFSCSGTKDWISVFKMSGGCCNLSSFLKEGCEKSEDYDSLPSSKILRLSPDRTEAIEYIKSRLIGKTIRVVAK